MKINTLNNNFTNENSYILSSIRTKDIKNIDDINKNNFNISNSPYITYVQQEPVIIKNINGKSVNNIILNNDIYEKFSEKITSPTTQSNHGLTALKEKINQKKLKESSNKNRKPKKRVKFKSNFIKVIEVQSFKKYYSNKYLNDDNCINCTCIIF